MTKPHPIVQCRKDRGNLSQEAFGAMFGVHAMTVHRWEKGESLPRRRFWPKLEELIGKPIAEIIAATEPAE